MAIVLIMQPQNGSDWKNKVHLGLGMAVALYGGRGAMAVAVRDK